MTKIQHGKAPQTISLTRRKHFILKAIYSSEPLTDAVTLLCSHMLIIPAAGVKVLLTS